MGSADERRVRLLELLTGSAGGAERDPFMFFPIIVGLMGPPPAGDDSPPPADRIVLVNPLTQGMVVLRTGAGPDYAALLREVLAGEGAPRGPPPASKASIEALRAVERPPGEEGEEEEEECVVCLDGLWAVAEGEQEKAGAVVKEMPCRHKFHGGCIERWLQIHGSCPVCRYQMPEEKPAGGKKEEEEPRRRRREVEREIWVTLGFGRRAAPEQADQADQQQQQQ